MAVWLDFIFCLCHDAMSGQKQNLKPHFRQSGVRLKRRKVDRLERLKVDRLERRKLT